MRKTYIPGPRTRLRWRWDRIALATGTGALFAVIGCWAIAIATSF